MMAKSITVVEDLGRFLAEESQSTMVTASGILSSCYGKERMMMFMMNIKESVDLNIFRCTSIFRCTISIRFAEKIPMLLEKIGGFLTIVASLGSMIWFLLKPPFEELKGLGHREVDIRNKYNSYLLSQRIL